MSTNPDMQQPQGHTKDQVNYRHYESCKTCAHYNGRIYCNKVQGHVSSDAVCDLWSMKEDTTGKTGKQFIMDEYTKSKVG